MRSISDLIHSPRDNHVGNLAIFIEKSLQNIFRLVAAIGDAYGLALLLHMLTSTIMLTLLAYQATKIDQVNVYALTVIGYLVYALAQVFLFCIFGNRLIEEVKLSKYQKKSIKTLIFSELVGYGSSLLVSLVRWVRRSKNFCPDCLSAMPEGNDNFWCKVLHCLTWFVCQRPRSSCHILHGAGSIKINPQMFFFRFFSFRFTDNKSNSISWRKKENVCGFDCLQARRREWGSGHVEIEMKSFFMIYLSWSNWYQSNDDW